MPKLLRLLLSVFAVLSLGVALAACGDDDDDADDTTTTEAAEEATDEGEDEGPPEGNPCAEGAAEEEDATEDGGADSEEGTDAPVEEPSADATPVEMGVLEANDSYAFTGGDELEEQGEYALTLNNTGQEMHMAFITRLADSETRSVEELINLPEDEQESIESTDLAETFACPGEVSEAVAVNIDQPGRYVVLCFISKGSTADVAELPAGPPHATLGMYKELTVS